MDRERYLKNISNRNAVLVAIVVTVLSSGLFIFLKILGGFFPIPLIIIIVTSVSITSFVTLLLTFKEMRKLADYWDNLLLYDQKFIPNLKKDYKESLYKMRMNPFEVTNYQLNMRMRYITPMLLAAVLLINGFLLFFYLTEDFRYPGFDSFARTFILIGNVMFLSIPVFLGAMLLLTSPAYSLYNFIVLREDDIVIINQINDMTIKNRAMYDSIWDVKKIRRRGSKHGPLNRWRLNLKWIYNHPSNGFYVPSLKEKELVRIRFRGSLKLLQYGNLVRRKKPKKFEYIETDSILLHMKDADMFIRELKRRTIR